MAEEQSGKGPPKRLGERLIEAGLITESQLSLALSEQRRNGGLLGEILSRLGFVTQADMAKLFATDLSTHYIDLASTVIDTELLQLIPLEFAKENLVIPLNREGKLLTVAMANGFDIMAIDSLERITGFHLDVVTAEPQAIQEAIEQKYVHVNTLENLIEYILRTGSIDEEDNSDADAPVVQLVDQIIVMAVRKRATDIHIEPDDAIVRVRFRIDGVLHSEILLPKELQYVVCARLKILGSLDVTEHRLPQDGRISFKLGRKQIDLRISTLPTQFGESVVMRILDRNQVILDLDSLGIADQEKDLFFDAIKSHHGIILVTGPTGSGKTTTLYAALSQMDSEHSSIFTLEDPVEYSLSMIRQTQVNTEIGMTFANGLRALLRQDPDVILVGEIRDEETAQLAVRAALTGHLVFATLHTNSAAGAIPRLINMGIEPYLISSTLVAVIAQRLVRKTCIHCAEPSSEAYEIAERLQIEVLPNETFLHGIGCPACFGRGCEGRIAVYEVLHQKHIKGLSITQGITELDVKEYAHERGMHTMVEDGIDKVRAGYCSMEEIAKVVG